MPGEGLEKPASGVQDGAPSPPPPRSRGTGEALAPVDVEGLRKWRREVQPVARGSASIGGCAVQMDSMNLLYRAVLGKGGRDSRATRGGGGRCGEAARPRAPRARRGALRAVPGPPPARRVAAPVRRGAPVSRAALGREGGVHGRTSALSSRRDRGSLGSGRGVLVTPCVIVVWRNSAFWHAPCFPERAESS